jgi:hypothetical protein
MSIDDEKNGIDPNATMIVNIKHHVENNRQMNMEIQNLKIQLKKKNEENNRLHKKLENKIYDRRMITEKYERIIAQWEIQYKELTDKLVNFEMIKPAPVFIVKDGGVEEEKLVERIWFEIKNMDGVELEWEWMAEGGAETEYLVRKEVLKIIEKHLKSFKAK